MNNPMTTDTHVAPRDAGSKTIVDITTPNVDFRNCEAIKAAIGSVVSGGKKNVILNLSQVNFMDSSGLSVILFCKRTCDDAGGTFGMFGLQTYVNNLVHLTNLNKSVTIYESEAESIA